MLQRIGSLRIRRREPIDDKKTNAVKSNPPIETQKTTNKNNVKTLDTNGPIKCSQLLCEKLPDLKEPMREEHILIDKKTSTPPPIIEDFQQPIESSIDEIGKPIGIFQRIGSMRIRKHEPIENKDNEVLESDQPMKSDQLKTNLPTKTTSLVDEKYATLNNKSPKDESGKLNLNKTITVSQPDIRISEKPLNSNDIRKDEKPLNLNAPIRGLRRFNSLRIRRPEPIEENNDSIRLMEERNAKLLNSNGPITGSQPLIETTTDSNAPIGILQRIGSLRIRKRQPIEEKSSIPSNLSPPIGLPCSCMNPNGPVKRSNFSNEQSLNLNTQIIDSRSSKNSPMRGSQRSIDEATNQVNSNAPMRALHRWSSLRIGKNASTERPRVFVRAVSSQALPEADTAYDAKQYFSSEVVDPWCEEDALERERQSQHAQLRELVARGDTQQLKAKLASLGPAAGLVANLTPGGANTLLYVASEAGLTQAVQALLEAGADGRAHPVTKYSPLYVAAYHGHKDIAKLLLQHFPEAAQQETVEKWLPLHAACIGGHAALVTLLLEFPYPDSACRTYTDASGQWQYRAAFDVNARDVSGQTALYVTCTLGNTALLDALLTHSVAAERRADQPSDTPPPPTQPCVSPYRGGISLGIHAIVSKLTGASNKAEPESHRIHPVRIDIPRGVDSCLACAVRGGHVQVVKRLLQAGASPDGSAAPPDHDQVSGEWGARRRSRSASAATRHHSTSPSPGRGFGNDRDGPWTALALAAHNKNIQLVEMLLNHGASDPHCRAIRQCARHGLVQLVAAILATKAYPDPDYKLNKATIAESVFNGRDGDSSLTFRGVCPATPVAVHWRELRCQLTHLRMSWLRTASLRVNSKLSSPKAALHALTRIDVSNNELRLLPAELFTLLSLRCLNAAQNKLERLPSLSDPFEDEVDRQGRKLKRRKNRPDVYTAPVLQELYLQDNRLEELPPELFNLPSLTTLDISNNKLRELPAAMWIAPSLRDLNAALNHLRDLPTGHEGKESTSPSQLLSPSDSSSQLSASCSPAVSATGSQFSFDKSKPWSRSTSIEPADSDGLEGDEEVPTLANRAGNALWSSARRAHTWRGTVEPLELPDSTAGACPLSALNLSHNQFVCVPRALACRAPKLARLNMAYNSLRSMSYVTSYPTSLRQLDLSHNEITCWPSLPQVENFGSTEGDPLSCFCPHPTGGGRPRPRSGGTVRSQLLSAACPARRHFRLEGLRTLILANNMLTRIQLTTDDDGLVSAPHDGSTDDDDDWNGGSSMKSRLLFPLLSMLDVSCNLLKSIPPSIHELSNLAVLNISGNKEITDLPPQMGLLSRLWNLNTAGCSLSEPLRSMVASGRYKSMDVVGYLKSVLQEAKPSRRMRLMLAGTQGIGKTSLLECLRQESPIQYRRKSTDHWAKRMGNKSSRRNVSTVGVDIGTWVYEKQRSNKGPITFRTWDFGGQQEYYATHQYFLSRRSLYLVVWKVTDGRKGLAAAVGWLRSIQARAPGSPVIMVATHYDQVPNSNLPESESPESLQRLIRSSIMGAPDADKLGLPRVLDSVEVSCSTRHNIRLLADIIYSVAFSVKPPGSKEPLLEQRIPATYLALEECVTSLAAELKQPVLRHEEYRRLVTQYMQQKNHRMFRDAAELHQATMFLHENGVLLHYDDAQLKELYFLNPQWLCDVLAHVVTIREINPFAQNGIMKIEDLAHVFKASPQLAAEEAGSLGLSLLNKFELALCWDARLLLVPPLLPTVQPQVAQLPLRSRVWPSHGSRGTPRRVWPNNLPTHLSTMPETARGTDSPTLIHESPSSITLTGRNGDFPLRRLLLLSYVPCGFWARLCTRVLADSTLAATVPLLYNAPNEVELDETLSKVLELNWGWRLWKTGLSLSCGDLTLLSLRELPADRDALLAGAAFEDMEPDPLYYNLRLRVKQEDLWCSLEVGAVACIELLLPGQVCVVRRDDGMPIAGYQSLSLEPNPEVLAKVLALLSDHVDLLLEDWYPSLGTRFVHTSEGRCLITRVVPCPACLRDLQRAGREVPSPPQLSQALNRLELVGVGAGEGRRPRLSEESRASGDSGVGPDSNASSRLGSVEGITNDPAKVAYGWTVEECILAACCSKPLHCPHHPDIRLRNVAPDTLLLDVEEPMRARWEHITRGSVAGRGAFGTVLAATWKRPGPAQPVAVALKALQPVPPPPGCDIAAQQAYKAALSRWEREPGACACRAYCALRQELGVLLSLSHPHVAPLRGVCCAPLALLLELAPRGALDGVLRQYRLCGARLGPRVVRALALQVARALEYLHARRIVYRDLKSENVLVWSMVAAGEAAAAETSQLPVPVTVKLGDYGISRLSPVGGTKGFGGTEGFMAPEIMRYNGEEEYTEKVDCFSYGMLLYEIMTLRQPFEGHEAVKEAVLDGARPPLSPRDLEYPCCLLELMRRCWLGTPALRPSAAALVCITAAPELVALQDAAAVNRTVSCAAGTPILAVDESGCGGWEVWCGGEAERVHSLLATPTAFTHHHTIRVPPEREEPVSVTAMCRVGAHMWLGDSAGRVSVVEISTCEITWCCRVSEAVGGAPSGVAALQALPSLQRVVVALACGRLFLVTSERPEAEGSFVLSELGAATELCCLAAVPTHQGFEVWAGGAGLYAYSVCGSGVCGADQLPEDGRVSLLAAASDPFVVATCDPGVCVYSWSVVSRRRVSRLDAGKLAPCSESLASIAIDERGDTTRCQVTSLCCIGNVAYIGTAWGCIIVADAPTLRPFTVFRPYEEGVVSMVPLLGHSGVRGPLLATLGCGYRPLVQRFAPSNNTQQQNTSPHSGFYCLLWRAHHWLPD